MRASSLLLASLALAYGYMPLGQQPAVPCRACRRPHPLLQADGGAPEEPAPSASPTASPADAPPQAAGADGEAPERGGLSFEERIAALSKQYENVVPMDLEERKAEEESLDRQSDDDENWLSPAFWAACKADLSDMEWPQPKKVFQTLYTSQLAFVFVVVLTLLFDAIFDATVRTILLGDEWSITIERILKVSNTQTM